MVYRRRYKRHRVTNPWGTTEQYNARMQGAYGTSLGDVIGDPRVQAVHNQCANMNAWYPDPNDPWEVDDMRPVKMGGKHVYTNLRIIRRSKNRAKHNRTEEHIALLIKYEAFKRDNGPELTPKELERYGVLELGADPFLGITELCQPKTITPQS